MTVMLLISRIKLTLCDFKTFFSLREDQSDSEDEAETKDADRDASDKSDMEEDQAEHAQTMDQSENATESLKQREHMEKLDEIHMSDADLHKLEKAARTGFKWMKPVFKDVLS